MKVADIPYSPEFLRKDFELFVLLERAAALERASWTDLFGDSGIYIVYWPNAQPIDFSSSTGRAAFATAKDPLALMERWAAMQSSSETDIIYIGKADSIRKRVRQLARFGVGKARNHVGGEWLWQVSDISTVRLRVQTCPPGQQIAFENWLLEEFFDQHSSYPLANRSGPQGLLRWNPSVPEARYLRESNDVSLK